MMKRKMSAWIIGCILTVLVFPMVSRADVVDVCWDGKEACWDDSDGEYTERYQVALYRGSTEVTRIKTTNTYYDFSSDMKKSGIYRFRVRAYEDGEYNAWTQYSAEKEVEGSSTGSTTSSSAAAVENNRNQNSGWNSSLTYAPYREGWYLLNGNWHYRYADGSEVKDTFVLLDGMWYNFNSQGVMRTGWYKRGNSWFYLDQSGAMVWGWQQIGGRWYYFNPSDGTMLADTTSPDGYQLGTDGAWIQ